ncbi:MAG: hypothetical protein KDD06_28285, partial [Phaeodactylibacter sp.]|nr:hypothetical protein [Phaeodactylibacter sp.]
NLLAFPQSWNFGQALGKNNLFSFEIFANWRGCFFRITNDYSVPSPNFSQVIFRILIPGHCPVLFQNTWLVLV